MHRGVLTAAGAITINLLVMCGACAETILNLWPGATPGKAVICAMA